MKNFVRCVLMGVCVLIGGVPLRAQNESVADTVDVCAPNKKKISLLGYIKNEQFPLFRQRDSMAIVGRGNSDTLSYIVSYRTDSIQFSGEYITSDGLVTISGYGDQYIQCEVSYTRTLQFEFKEPFFQSNTDNSDSLVEHWKHELFGVEDTDLPTTILQSKRRWRCIVRIKKSLSPNETFAIVGDTCMLNNVKLRVPDQYADMKCRWTSERYVAMSNPFNAHEITVSRRNVPFLTTLVTCTLSGCDDKAVSSSIRLRTKYTPASELTFNDCLPTASRSITVKASNTMPGVHYEWVGLSVVREISSDSMSETISYPAPGSDNFTIKLNTSGGCLPDKKEVTVHRKLGNDVKLVVLDSCLAAGIPFRMATDPQLPNMDLTWSLPAGCYLVGFLGSDARKDMVVIIKNASMIGQTASVKVSDEVCKGSTSEYISISESYTEMEARLAGAIANGLLLHDGDSVPPGEKIKFTAPVHSSISGYTWYISCNDGSPSRALRGESELTVTAPTNGYTITVSVSYISCFGPQRHTYRLKSMDEFNRLFGE